MPEQLTALMSAIREGESVGGDGTKTYKFNQKVRLAIVLDLILVICPGSHSIVSCGSGCWCPGITVITRG